MCQIICLSPRLSCSWVNIYHQAVLMLYTVNTYHQAVPSERALYLFLNKIEFLFQHYLPKYYYAHKAIIWIYDVIITQYTEKLCPHLTSRANFASHSHISGGGILLLFTATTILIAKTTVCRVWNGLHTYLAKIYGFRIQQNHRKNTHTEKKHYKNIIAVGKWVLK